MMKYARYAVRVAGFATFLALMLFNINIMGPQGVQGTVSSGSTECIECDENTRWCVTYCYPDGSCTAEYDEEAPIVITPGSEESELDRTSSN